MLAINDRSLGRSTSLLVESAAESIGRSPRDQLHAQITLEIDSLFELDERRAVNRSIAESIVESVPAIDPIEQPAAPRPRYNGTEPCVGRDDLFLAPVPVGGFKVRNPHLTAAQLCTGCHFREPCLEYGLEQSIGVWGGLDPAARAELLKARAEVAS